MKHLVVGGVSFILGLIGLVTWWKTFGLVMRGVIPFALLMLGIVALLSGYRRVSAAPREDTAGGGKAENEADA